MRLCALANVVAAVAAIQILFPSSCVRAADLAPAAPSTASADKILLSIPDAGGLRTTVKPDSSLHIPVGGKDLPADAPSVPLVAFTAGTSGYVNGGSATVGAEHNLDQYLRERMLLRRRKRRIPAPYPTGDKYAAEPLQVD